MERRGEAGVPNARAWPRRIREEGLAHPQWFDRFECVDPTSCSRAELVSMIDGCPSDLMQGMLFTRLVDRILRSHGSAELLGQFGPPAFDEAKRLEVCRLKLLAISAEHSGWFDQLDGLDSGHCTRQDLEALLLVAPCPFLAGMMLEQLVMHAEVLEAALARNRTGH